MPKVSLRCPVCQSTFTSTPSAAVRRVTCSHKCRVRYIHGSLDERIWSLIDKRDAEACWEWLGGKQKEGYGRTRDGDTIVLAHRYVYEQCVGPIPEGQHVLHECDNPPCCNPRHLKAGTAFQNRQDCVAKNRHAYGDKSWNSKLTEDTVREIKQVYSTGNLSQAEIAKAFSVSRSTVAAVLTGRNWRWVE